MDIRIDIDKLRDYLEDECGAAAFGGFSAAMMDVWEIEKKSGYELCRKAEEMGVDLNQFQCR